MARSPRHDATSSLSALPPGSTARLCDVRLATAARLRLAELGLRPGAVVRVVNRTPGGGCVVGLGTSRVAVDRHTARNVAVESVGAVESVETVGATTR
jgi:ferrous iron transport protein A